MKSAFAAPIAMLAAVSLAFAAPAMTQAAPATVGKTAPAFTLKDSNGKTVSLKDYRGKLVILEWTNHDCPYVRKHYNSKNMQRLQADARKMGVVWLTIISSAPGTQGHVSPAEANDLTKSRGAQPNHVLHDPEGTVGQMYGAKTTPHMYIILKDGTLAYMGAIDDKRSSRLSTVKTAKNYVRAALKEIRAGKPVTETSTVPYGCSVKYKQGA